MINTSRVNASRRLVQRNYKNKTIENITKLTRREMISNNSLISKLDEEKSKGSVTLTIKSCWFYATFLQQQMISLPVDGTFTTMKTLPSTAENARAVK